jgi:two-component system, cell cycle sensor histidine kinase and response regulator CckA
VANLARMLQRIIGEDVRLQLHLHPTSLMTRADVGMLDQVILNLAVNARDAMPEGGRLLIETAERIVDETFARAQPDAAPGRYVLLSVSDTGTGIAPEILPHIFEPFFTTKEPGKGTGLGLATVYGIVKQHRGWIHAYSQPGQGTSFQVFLPAIEVPARKLVPGTAPFTPRGGSETILVAEDEQGVRMLIRAVLERYGYQVLEAANGDEALGVWEKHRDKAALLLTDLIMPGSLSGQQLARRLQSESPDLKVIFVSGYSAELAGRELELRAGENFLQKPFGPNQLLETIRQCLDR